MLYRFHSCIYKIIYYNPMEKLMPYIYTRHHMEETNSPSFKSLEKQEAKYLKLRELFYSPKTGFTNVNDLITNTKKNNIHLSALDIIKWYQDQPVNQQYKPSKASSSVKHPNISFTADHPGRIIADLIELSLLSKYNNGHKWI